METTLTDEPALKKSKLDSASAETTGANNDADGNDDLKDDEEVEDNTGELLKEEDVGITHYMTQLPGFNGVIKQRFSDFLVNEISADGNIVHLTDLKAPETTNEQEKKVDLTESDLELIFKDSLPLIKDLYETQNNDQKVYVQVADDKEARTMVHQTIRTQYPGLESKTTQHDGNKCIMVTVEGKTSSRNQQRWDTKLGDYCHCVMYKEAIDTMQAINKLSQNLRKPATKFGYAGTKDRRAKTCQKISVHRVTPERLSLLNNSRQLKGMSLGNFHYSKEQIKLGDLRGNHFTIVLRSVDGTKDVIDKSLESLKTLGFVNYYGMQRFGTTSVSTHSVGILMLQNKWKEVVEMILKPRKGDNAIMDAARVEWQRTGNASAAVKKLGHRFCNERHLWVGLGKHHDNDYIGALSCIPRNSRQMYLHSFQSFIWNKVVSERIKLYGLKLQPGDLVLPANSCYSKEGSEKNKKSEPVVITAENTDTYNIYDLVLPLPGYAISLPQNDIRDSYKKLLEEQDLSLDSFNHHIKDYSLPGDYRHVFILPERLSWSTHIYEDVTQSLVLSDLEKLKGEKLQSCDKEDGQLALKIEFSLPSSTYATMALREILRTDTSSAHQATLNV